MTNDVEQPSASYTEVDKAITPNKKKGIDVGSASGVDKDINNEINLDMEDDDYLSTSSSIADIECIATRLQQTKMKSSQQERAKHCCIYRVPNWLRKVKPEAYTPQLISLGPLHGNDKGLKAMKNEKLRYFREFIKQYKMDDHEKICSLVRIVEAKEKDIKVCYSKDFTKIKINDFIEMIVLDAFFIIEFLKDFYFCEKVSKDSKEVKNTKKFENRMIFDIREDLMLLENQLPFFIVKEIYNEVNRPCEVEKSIDFDCLVAFYFEKYTFLQGKETIKIVQRSRHFTDLLRNFMLNGVDEGRIFNYFPTKLKYSAVMLHKAGVKFQFMTRDKCLVNIKFKKGVLKMRRLEVDYRFERLVRNIMALEQCSEPSKAYICSYIKFMDHLINSAEDVELLVKKGIILHWLGDDATVSNMINKLCENISDTYTCYNKICQDMNDHYKNRCNHRKATLKLVYFNNVWRGTATVAAAVLLILTLIQTIASVKSAL